MTKATQMLSKTAFKLKKASLMPLRMEALVVALGTLGSAIGVFIAGVIAGLGTAAGSIAIAIAEIIVSVCNAIAQAVPAIGNALTKLIVAICNVIVQCSEPIGQALFTLGTVATRTARPAYRRISARRSTRASATA